MAFPTDTLGSLSHAEYDDCVPRNRHSLELYTVSRVDPVLGGHVSTGQRFPTPCQAQGSPEFQ
jgi:hypothetical protein